jgi:hypothetical protein
MSAKPAAAVAMPARPVADSMSDVIAAGSRPAIQISSRFSRSAVRLRWSRV